jgi:polyhydroxybutyrate depolymerase
MRLVVLLCLIMIFGCQNRRGIASSNRLQAGSYDFYLTHDGLQRKYILYLPQGYQNEKTYPLVMAFHGGGGNARIQATDRFYRLISSADKNGYVIVFPNGVGVNGGERLATWNAGLCCGQARDKKVDDVGFARELVKEISTKVKIDKRRVFATGISNGAMMSYRLACEAPDLIRSIAAVAGTDNTVSCPGQKTVSILHIHSLQDEHVRYQGGRGEAAVRDDIVNDFVSVPATIEKWVKRNGCQKDPARVFSNESAYCDEYSCKESTTVKLCVTKDGGHSWPGGSKPLPRGPQPSQAINATEVIWEFFANQK